MLDTYIPVEAAVVPPLHLRTAAVGHTAGGQAGRRAGSLGQEPEADTAAAVPEGTGAGNSQGVAGKPSPTSTILSQDIRKRSVEKQYMPTYVHRHIVSQASPS